MDKDIFLTHHVSIDKRALALLPSASYNGEVVVIDKEEDVDQAVDVLEKAAILGFDTETKPAFRRGVVHFVSLLQLSTPQRCYLFRLNKIGVPRRLINLLENAGNLKVGLSLHDDFHNLTKLCKFSPDGFIDLQQYVKRFHIADNSLTRIHAILFGERISKGQRLTNWEASTLSPAQMNYAALDAMSCIRIYEYLKSGAFDPAHSPYLVEIPEPANPAKEE